MANTNEVEQLNLRVSADTADASSVVQELLNSFTKLQNGLIQTNRQATKFDGALGTTFQKLVKDLDRLLPEINKLNTMMNSGSAGWGEVVNVLKKLNPTLIAYQNKLDVINRSIKEQNTLLKESEKLELTRNKALIINAQERARINRIDITSTNDKLSKLQEEKRVLQDTYLTAKKLGEDSVKLESILLQIKLKNKQIMAEEYSNQQRLNKATLESQIISAKVALNRAMEAEKLTTSLGRAQLKSKEMLVELAILKKAEQTEENILRIQKLQNALSMQGSVIRVARLKEAEALQRMNDREAEYNNVMSLHSAKRALGYTALFAGIGAVTGAFGAMISNVMEADLQMRTLGAVLKLNLTQARDLSESVRTLGETYGGSLKEIEGVALALARAGIATKDMIPATEIVLRMARLTGDTFEQSASAIISFQQVFGDTTNIETLGNKLAYIANMSRLSTQDIGTFSNYALAAAKAVGMTEDAVGALATAFSVAGSNASTIGTQIRTITAIFSENSKDIVGFFNGIGVSQEGMRDKLQQGGKVSNQAMKDFIEVLGNVDNMTFNKLTGSMDKLTVNALNLMRNNKDNVTRFMNELEAGAQGQLKVVDTILEAHRVTIEKWWNNALNYSQKKVTELEEMVSNQKLLTQINRISGALNSSWFKSESEYQDVSNEELSKKLAELKMIKKIKEDEIKLTELTAKIEKSTGEEYLKLSEEKKALIIKIAEERDSLETKTVGKTKEQIALEIKNRETVLAGYKKDIIGLDTKTAKYIALTAQIREQEDELKKLNKTSNLPSVAQVSGTSLAEIAKDIQDKVSTGDTNVLAEINSLTMARTKAVEDLTKEMEAYYAFEFKNNKEVANHIREVAGGDANQVATKEGLLKLQAEAVEKMEYSNVLTAALQDKTANVDDETRKYIEGLINANSVFGRAYNKLAELLGLQKVAFRTAEEAQQDATDASLKRLEVENKIKTAQDVKKIYESGGSDLAVQKKKLDNLREEIKIADGIDASENGRRERAQKLAEAEVDYAKAVNTEKSKGASADDKASKELYRRLEAEKAIASLNLEISQYQEGSYGTALGQAQVAKLELDFANKNLATAIQAKAEATEIAKLKRDISKAELESLKANDAANKQALEQKQSWEDIGLAWQQFLDQDTSPLNEALISAQNNARKIQEQIDAGGLNSIDLDKKKQELAQALLDIEKQRLAIEIESIELKANKELRALEAQSAQLERMSMIRDAMATSDNESINNALKLADTLGNISNREIALQQDRINLQAQYDKDVKDTSKNQAEVQAKYTHDKMLLDKKAQTSEMAGYMQIAGAMSNMFEQGSKDAQNFQRIQAGLAMVAGIQAILTQGQGDPYSAPARMLAMAGMVISVLANAKIAFGGIGGVKTTKSSDSLSAIKANTGTGTVLGDTEAQSESITKSLDILKDYARPEYQLLSSMNKYLSHIASGIGGVSSLLIQEGGFAFGQGFQSTDSGWKNKVSADSAGVKGASIVAAGVQDYATLTAGGVGTAFPLAIGTMLIDKYLLGGTINKLTNKILGGIFGKTSVSSKMKDSGMFFADQLLTEATKNFVGSAYQTVETTTTKKSWWDKSTDVSSKTKTQGLSDQTNRQFTMVIDNLYKTTLLAGEALDTATSTVEDRLKNFVVSIGKISLYKQSGDQIQKNLEAIFGRLGDQIATSAFPLLKDFQAIGEGMFETMTRVATGMEEAEYYIERLGYQFQDISYWEIINKSGNVGFEALLQSIVKTDEATYGLNNNLVQIIGSLDSTAEELYGAYTILDGLRGRLQFLNQNIAGLSFSMIRGAGSVDALNSGFESFFENFLTESEQLSYNTSVITKEFSKLNLTLPTSKEAYKQLLQGIDLTSEAGQELYGRLILLSEGFADVADKVQDSIKVLEEQLAEKGTKAFDDFNTALSALFKSLQGMISRTKSMISQITEESLEEDLYTKLVKYNKLFDEFKEGQSEETYDAILALSQVLAKDTDVAPAVIKRLNDSLFELTQKEDVLRVNVVDGLGELLKLNSTQVTQLKAAVKDGKVTNQELDSITGLTIEQRDGIKEFAENSSAFSTENTLASLEAYAQQQLEVFKQDVAKEKANLSTNTFKYGDYVGLQEQVDISRALGVSYDSAKPLVQELQALSVSTDLNRDLSKLLNYGGYEYDTVKVAQIEKLGAYLNPDILKIISAGKTESASNIQKRDTFEAAKNEFNQRLALANTTLSSLKESLVEAQGHYAYWDDKVSKTDNGSSNYDKYKANRAVAAQAYWVDIPQNISAQLDILSKLEAEKKLKGYYTGGYTGDGGVHDVAGVVHKGEYVLSQNDLKNVGGRGSVEAFIRGTSPSIVVNLDPLIQEMKALKQENENMRQLLVKIAADGTKALNTQRGILDAVTTEEV